MVSKFNFIVAAFLAVSCFQPAFAAPVVCQSPGQGLSIEFDLHSDGNIQNVPHFRVRHGDHDVIEWSRLGMDLGDSTILGGPCEVLRVQTRPIHDRYLQFPGKRSTVIANANEITLHLREKTNPNRQWDLVMRAYDDGVAFRYRFPAQDGWPQLEISGERTVFHWPGDPATFAMPLPSFTTPHEEHYRHSHISELPTNGLVGMPLLVELPHLGWAALLEADLTDYAAMYLVRTGDHGLALSTRLAPLPREPKVAVRAALPHESPWRVVMFADKVERLIESDLLLNLNKPNAVGDVSWIKPGNTTFPWWNGFYESHVPFKMGLNTETAKYYIDFCAEAGIACHSLDGLENVAWYGGPIVPYQGANIIQGGPGLDLPEVIRYAKWKNVKLRLWMNWKAADKYMDQAFPLYEQWGIQGVMVDFLDRDDQEISHFIHRLLETAAAHHLTVTIHNTKEPTGLERTYPNLLTTEGDRNWEYDKWDPAGISPEETLMVPFTRMLAGPLDYHQGSLRGVGAAEYKPRNAAPLVIATPCQMLASYVVFENHLPMMADYPSAYRGNALLPAMTAIPTTWDDIFVPQGEVGQVIVIARRSGNSWHLGAMTNNTPRKLNVPLSFLKAGQYRAEIWTDDLKSKYHAARKESTVSSTDTLTLSLAPAGGAYVKLVPSAAR